MTPSSLFNFFKNPTPNTVGHKKLVYKLYVYITGFLLCMIGIVISVYIKKIFGLYFDVTKLNKISYELSLHNFLLVVLIAPILEELGFRLFLKPKKRVFIPISFTIIIYLILFLPYQYINIYIEVIITVILFFIVYYFEPELLKLIKKHYVFILYFTALIFSLLHLNASNFESFNEIYAIPVVLFPYFIYALSFSYVRMKAGIEFSILLHISINGFAYFMKYLMSLILLN